MKILSFVLFLLISGPGFAKSSGGESASPFIAIDPPIVVNIFDGNNIRHMQINIEIKLFDPLRADKVELHKGPIRHGLILLLSSQEATQINSSEGKEELRNAALETVQGVLNELEGEPIIEALYFTNFIIQ